MADYNYGSAILEMMNNKRLEDLAQAEKNKMMEPNVTAALVALLSKGISEGATQEADWGKFTSPKTMVEGAKSIDWGKFVSPGALMSGLKGGMQPTVGNARDVLSGFGSAAEVGKEEEAAKLAKQEREEKRLMEILEKRIQVLKEFEMMPQGTPGSFNLSEQIPIMQGKPIEGKPGEFEPAYAKRKSPFDAMMNDPVIGPVVMKALGVKSAGNKGGGPWQMYNPTTKDWATADTIEDVAQGYKEGYTLTTNQEKK